MWGPHNIEAKFSIHGSGKITQLINGFKKMLDAEGLTPEQFNGFLVLKTTMNDGDAKSDQEKLVREAMVFLRRVPKGHVLIVGPGNERIWCITNPNWQIKTDSYMKILGEAGHPMIDACHTYDTMVKNVAKNDAYHMLDTPHNELHMVTLMVASCKFLSLFSAIISMDTLLPPSAAAGTMEQIATAVGDDSHMAVPAAR